ncbi:MAG: hypothetical protein ABIR10_05525 [Dokdonella sp.]
MFGTLANLIIATEKLATTQRVTHKLQLPKKPLTSGSTRASKGCGYSYR